MYLLRLLTGSFILAGTLAACDAEEGCISLPTNQYQIGFYAINKEGKFPAGPFFYDNIEALRSDSVFYKDRPEGAATVSLALDPGADSTTFVFKYRDKADTLKVSYNRIFKMISPECGLEVKYTGLEVYSHTFDSINVLKTELLTTDKEFDLAIFELDSCVSSFPQEVRAGFKTTNEAGAEVNDFVYFDEVRAVGADEAVYTRTTNGTDRLSFPLDPATQQTTYVFTEGESTDTLIFNYTAEKKIFSPGCGLKDRFTGITVSGTNSFKTVRVINSELSETSQGFDIEIVK